jgi:hypothetical protein
MLWIQMLGCHHQPGAADTPAVVSRIVEGPGRARIRKDVVTNLLGANVVDACPDDQRCVFSIGGSTLLLEPRGPSWVIRMQDAWIPANRASWTLQDHVGTRVPFPSTLGPPPPSAQWQEVPQTSVGRPALAVQLSTQPVWHFHTLLQDGQLTALEYPGWPPMDRSGLQVRDVVKAVNGVAVATTGEVRAVLDAAAGGPVSVLVSRDGQELEFTVASDPLQLRCWKFWSEDGAELALAPNSEPPAGAVQIECPAGAVSLTGVRP